MVFTKGMVFAVTLQSILTAISLVHCFMVGWSVMWMATFTSVAQSISRVLSFGMEVIMLSDCRGNGANSMLS